MKKNTYTARQPIFNRKGGVVAYELLFREGAENVFPRHVDPHAATSKLIAQTHLNEGLHHVTLGKPAFINFSEHCLLNDTAHMLPKANVIIEILETIPPTDEMYNKCVALHRMGYRLAFDDFVYAKEWNRFLAIASIVKIDIQKTPIHTIRPLIDALKEKLPKLKLLAEKVETEAEFDEAKLCGFHFFQGYFFSKPEMVKHSDIEMNEPLMLQLFQLISRPVLDMSKIASCFESDVALAFKLLTYINSGIMPISVEIRSIRQALAYLGEMNVRRLVALLATNIVAQKKSKEITLFSTVRAKASENIANKLLSKKNTPSKTSVSLPEEAFMVGLLSMIDALLDRPMDVILPKLGVSKSIQSALINKDEQSDLRIILNVVLCAERGAWHETSKESLKLALLYSDVAKAMDEAQHWTQKISYADAKSSNG